MKRVNYAYTVIVRAIPNKVCMLKQTQPQSRSQLMYIKLISITCPVADVQCILPNSSTYIASKCFCLSILSVFNVSSIIEIIDV